MRINKFIASAGKYSRREADSVVESGQVMINGKKAKLGDQVEKNDKVTINGKPIKTIEQKYYIAFNKPYGVITTTNPEMDNNVMDYIKTPVRLFPVGRLDVHSTGLILLTNDGDTAQKLMKSENQKEKEYIVTLEKPITDDDLKKMEKGIKLEDKKTLPAKIRRIHPEQFSITITQGMNRQVRRMCEELGYNVKILKRVRIAGVRLGEVARGKWRYLDEKEIESLK